MIEVRREERRVCFWVQVVPRASRNAIQGEAEGVLRVAIQAPPVENAANEELIRFLADELGVARRQITILAGHHQRRKRIAIEAIGEDALRLALSNRSLH
ncbi:MAG: DUF167 domain-containing protein [Blastocatellia bacterium]